MPSIVISRRGARSVRFGESVSIRATVLVLTAWLLAGWVAGSVDAQVLQWKFKPGEVLRYSMEQKISMTARGMDRETKQTRSQIVEMSWKVNNVTGDGQAELVQRIDRVRLRVEAPPLMPFEFDSNAPKAEAQAPFEAEARMLRAMAAAEFTFRMKPSGAIEDIRFPEQTLKALREATPGGAPEGEVSEKLLKDTLTQSSPPAFPEGPLEPGKTWSDKPARVPSPLGTMVLNKTYTFQGPDPKNPRLMLIVVDTKVALEPAPGAPITAELRKQEGKGTMTFDAEAGHVVSTRGTQKTEMTITVMDQRIEQTIETTTTMTLVP
jgi:hypothetical protein